MRWGRWVKLCLPLLLVAAAPPLPGVGSGDTRTVVDGRAPPWTGVLRLFVPGVSACTATLIGPRIALTAAHCLWSNRLGHFVPPHMLHVLSRYAGGDFGSLSLAAGYRLAPGWDPARREATLADDLAVVTLARPVGGTGDVLRLDDAPVPAGTQAMLGGYNQDRAQVIEADAACHVIGSLAGAQTGTLLVHDCAATRGTSGAPLLVPGPGGVWRIAGIQVAARAQGRGGVAVGAARLQALLAASAGDAP